MYLPFVLGPGFDSGTTKNACDIAALDKGGDLSALHMYSLFLHLAEWFLETCLEPHSVETN